MEIAARIATLISLTESAGADLPISKDLRPGGRTSARSPVVRPAYSDRMLVFGTDCRRAHSRNVDYVVMVKGGAKVFLPDCRW
jgi:hypothetical protein